MADEADTSERIRALMAEGGLDPTPSHYAFLYRYVTGADPALTEAADAARATAGRLSAATIVTLRRAHCGIGTGGVGRLIDDASDQIERMTDTIGRGDADARDYRERLGRVDPTATLDRQRAMLADMIEATATMIERTEALRLELARSAQEVAYLKADLEQARIEARCDPLTGLANRKACGDYLDARILRAREEGTPLSLVFLDVDHFKRINDGFGHRMGDEVLRLVAQSLERAFHGIGFVARWGGEEFVVVLPDHDATEAVEQAERFREQIAARRIRTRGTGVEVGRVTLSLGVSSLRADDDAQPLIERADRALYAAKAEGRDRVVCWREAA